MQIEILRIGNSEGITSEIAFEHKLPPSKLMWLPEPNSDSPDLLISSSDTLKVWEIIDNKEVELKSSLWNVIFILTHRLSKRSSLLP